MTRECRRAAGRLRRQRGAAALAVVALALLGPTLGSNPAAAARPHVVQPLSLPLTVRLAAIQPLAPQPGDTLVLTGTLRNESDDTVDTIDISLRYRSDRVGSRSEFDDYATTASGPVPSRRASAATITLRTRTLEPAAAESFAIRVPVDSLGLDARSWQVHEIGVEVSGTTAAGSQTVGRLRTFLPWAPKNVPGVGLPTQVAWIWPLDDRPHRSVGSTWVDDDLAAALTPDGRLGRLLAAGAAAQAQHTPPTRPRTQRERQLHISLPQPPTVTPVPVTFAVDPMLVQDVVGMTDNYRVTVGRTVEAGRGSAFARTWLAELRAAAARGSVLALPYADPDVVAATRSGLANEVQVAIQKGAALLTDSLGVSPLTYAWPPGGVVDQHTVDTLFTAGVTTAVLDGAALPIVGGEPSETPGSHTILPARENNLDALLVDSGLRAVVDAGLANPALQPLALQRFLAELLMIQAESPFDQRALVVAPDRRWNPAPNYAAALLADTGKVPWIQPIPLSAAAQAPLSTKVVRQPLQYPPKARAAELTPGYLLQVRKAKGRADAFASILTVPGDATARDYDDAVLRSLSSAWRDDPIDAGARLTAVRTALSDTMRRVRIVSAARSFVTLTSHSGTVPITVTNELDTPVRVILRISSLHLKVTGGGTAQVIPAHRKVPIDVKAAAKTSGVFQLNVELDTPSGLTYQKLQLFVRSTAYGTVTLLITGGATGVLMVAVVVRLVRRGLRARRTRSRATATA